MWSFTAPQGIELGAGIVFALVWFWYRRGYFIEGRMWAERVLASPLIQADFCRAHWRLGPAA